MKAFFAFAGQGAQTVGMGRDLAESSAAAAACFQRADEICGFSLSSIIFQGPDEELTRTRFCQPAIYTMSCAALAAFREKFPGVKPVSCAGLSLGEYGALHAAGAFSFETGLKLLLKRAELMEAACSAHPGTMATVLGGDPAVIEAVCKEVDLDVANYNCPGQIVLSGEAAKVESAVAKLKEQGFRKVILLKVAGAFHSRLMADAGAALVPALEAAEIRMPEVPVYHNFSAEPAADPAGIRSALAAQVAGSVRWEACFRKAVAAGADTIVEFGPGTVLTGLARRTVPEIRYVNINSASALAEATMEDK